MYDLLIVGAGIYGALLARAFSRYSGKCLVLEKENDVGNGSSGANSAILHSGYDPVPGTNKAFYNAASIGMYPRILGDLEVPYRRIGSLTVSFEADVSPLSELLERAGKNGVEARIVGRDELRKMEPSVSKEATGALFAPGAMIVDPFLLVSRAMENAIDNGVDLKLGEEVSSLEKSGDAYRAVTDSGGVYEARSVIVCAGPYTEKLIAPLGYPAYGSYVRKGCYYVLDHFGRLVDHVVFPLPGKKGKGILVTPTTSGNYLLGPTSEPHGGFGDVSTSREELSMVLEGARKLIPDLPIGETIRVYAGNRASSQGGDFIVGGGEGFWYLGGIDSPGLASAPALSYSLIDEKIAPFIKLKKNESYNPKVRHYIRPMQLGEEERERLYKEKPEYAEIVCSCEKISRGEMEDALGRSLPCLSLKALKKRTRAGFGRCQGGFCQPLSIGIIAGKLGIDEGEVPYDKAGSRISLKEIRGE